ncbi:hypothetical protein [Arthrobacter rhombi]|uniref:hypothetical protein n=1 Tax=Arthrobacter rhombi TaxID=71253 RepID=UPI003FD593B7
MAGKKQLPPVRFADDSDAPGPEKEPMKLLEAIASGSRLDILKAQRLILAGHERNGDTLARDVAAIMRQSREMDKEIEALEAQEAERREGGGDDDEYSGDEAWNPAAI